jgi:two-component system response regulator PilR (NtrC family)
MLVQTSFGFRLSTPSGIPIPAGDIPPMAKKSPSRRILVVDDEPLVRWSIAEMLQISGYDVSEAGDADAAVRILLAEGPTIDAVLLDLRLPDSNDLRLLQAVRRLVPFAPIVLMTAFGTPEVADDARRLGAYAVLDKPFDLTELGPLLASALE